MELFGRVFDAPERGEVQLEPDGLLPGLSQQLRDGGFGPCLVSRSDIHLGILFQKRLMEGDAEVSAGRDASPESDGYLACGLADARIAAGDDGDLSAQVRDILRRELWAGHEEVGPEGRSVEKLPEDLESGECAHPECRLPGPGSVVGIDL